tara:strand:- start:330 stop:587 length:258 start_codon:yes stop_codon:yes gene_type:complete
MAKNKTYNGWSNKETWNTNLWLSSHSKGMEQTVLRIMNLKHTNWFADNLEGYIKIIWGKTTPDGYSLDFVNWNEIAECWLENYKQ